MGVAPIESKGSQSTRLVASTSSILPVYGVAALGLWRYGWTIPIVIGVSLIGWSGRSVLRFAVGYVIAFLLGVAMHAADASQASKGLLALPVYLAWVAVIWQCYRSEPVRT